MAATTDLAQEIYAALDADDVDGFLALCDDAVEIVYPAAGVLAYGGRWRGHDGAAAFLAAHDAAEEILLFERGEMVADAETVLVRGHFRGRARETGREWATEFAHELTFLGGRLSRWQAFFDTAAAVAAHDTRSP